MATQTRTRKLREVRDEGENIQAMTLDLGRTLQLACDQYGRIRAAQRGLQPDLQAWACIELGRRPRPVPEEAA